MNAERTRRFSLRLVERGQRASRALGEFYVKGVVRSQTMVSANALDRPCDLFQSGVVECRPQDLERLEERHGLFRRYSSPAFAHQQRSSMASDESVCSSGKHHDKVTEASMTMQFILRTRLVAKLADRHSSEREPMGFSKAFKRLDSLDNLTRRCGPLGVVSERSRAIGKPSGSLNQTGSIRIDRNSPRCGLTDEFLTTTLSSLANQCGPPSLSRVTETFKLSHKPNQWFGAIPKNPNPNPELL